MSSRKRKAVDSKSKKEKEEEIVSEEEEKEEKKRELTKATVTKKSKKSSAETKSSSKKAKTSASSKSKKSKKEKEESSEEDSSGEESLSTEHDSNVENDEEAASTTDAKHMNAAVKILCWNVNGIRAWMKKPTTVRYIQDVKPDIICLQEVKCSKEDIPKEFFKAFPNYEVHWLVGEKAGYAGTAMLTLKKPVDVTFGLGHKEHDAEGRVITAEFDKFFLINAYVPNSGRGLPRLDYRTTQWEPVMREYLSKLDAKKPVILCGDLNVAHREIDLTNPKTNLKNAGFTPAERAEFDKLLKLGFTDSFRHFYPNKTGAYTFWSARGGARENNVGWRLDYYVVSQRFTSKLVDSVIAGNKVLGSDHCPILLYANP